MRDNGDIARWLARQWPENDVMSAPAYLVEILLPMELANNNRSSRAG